MMSHQQFSITSPAFKDNGLIPAKYTCDGLNINPPLDFDNVPGHAKSLALIVDDPDATKGTFDHWIMWNIAPGQGIDENSAPGIQGLNGKKENKYTGPCPPGGTHHYRFLLYALDTMLGLDHGSDKQALHQAMRGHIIATAELIGLYKKEN